MKKLRVNHLTKAVTIAGKIGNNVAVTKDMTAEQIGMAYFLSAMELAETEITELLADIAEMSIEEFKQQPMDFALQVIEEVAEKEDLMSFLERAKALNKIFKRA
jgi:hypothetical protein